MPVRAHRVLGAVHRDHGQNLRARTGGRALAVDAGNEASRESYDQTGAVGRVVPGIAILRDLNRRYLGLCARWQRARRASLAQEGQTSGHQRPWEGEDACIGRRRDSELRNEFARATHYAARIAAVVGPARQHAADGVERALAGIIAKVRRSQRFACPYPNCCRTASGPFREIEAAQRRLLS